jgi:hypothetical protein
MLKIPKLLRADRRSAGVAADANITDHATRIRAIGRQVMKGIIRCEFGIACDSISSFFGEM